MCMGKTELHGHCLHHLHHIAFAHGTSTNINSLISIQHSKMSAPNPGRQSPDPERQSGAQAGQISDNVNKQGAGPQEGAEQASDNTKNSLSSNPEHPLKQHSEETTSKKV